jgi:hypothetical protein
MIATEIKAAENKRVRVRSATVIHAENRDHCGEALCGLFPTMRDLSELYIRRPLIASSRPRCRYCA